MSDSSDKDVLTPVELQETVQNAELSLQERVMKQIPSKPTKPRGTIAGDKTPGPQKYDIPYLLGGNGFGNIKRAPAYTFGIKTPFNVTKPVAKPYAPLFDIHGMGKKGPYKVRGGVVGEKFEPLCDRSCRPGPAAYQPHFNICVKRAPAYGCRLAPKPRYQSSDMWTPPPNMYLPQIPGKSAPEFTLGFAVRKKTMACQPGPGEHDPKFSYLKQSGPAFSFGHKFKPHGQLLITPSSNQYCEKKFLVTKRRAPAHSFGIRHSKFIGERAVFLKTPDLDVVPNDGS